MAFCLGDYVLVLDEDLSGFVKAISDKTVSIETDDGFLLDFKTNELVTTKPKQTFKNELFSHKSINAVISEKKQFKRKAKVKDQYETIIEVDLHIGQLVKSSKGMSNHDMLTLQLDTARRQLDFAIKKRIQKLVLIHGVGKGVLKIELEHLFGRYDNLKFYDANYQKYGLGATEVYIYQNPN